MTRREIVLRALESVRYATAKQLAACAPKPKRKTHFDD